MKWYIVLIFSSLSFFAKAQSGCTDPQASNYDEAANSNDGSCIYPNTSYAPIQITELPDELIEASGLAFFNGELWTQTDGGGEDRLYQIDTLTSEIEREVIIATADNEDWEDLAESDTHIYIGDFGNNSGNRTNLSIYKISKADIATNNVVNAELIEFAYEDQTDFEVAHNDNDFDCEAFIFYNDSLHLFTKNWVDEQTKHYILPNTPGNHTAELRETFNIDGLITAADINDDGVIALLGYRPTGITFMWLLSDYTDNQFFSGNKRLITLGSGIQNSQTEGIVYRSNSRGYICSEEFLAFPAKLLSFETEQWFNNPTSSIEVAFEQNVHCYPNPTNDYLHMELPNERIELHLFDIYGKMHLSIISEEGGTFDLDLSLLPRGFYLLDIHSKAYQFERLIIKQ